MAYKDAHDAIRKTTLKFTPYAVENIPIELNPIPESGMNLPENTWSKSHFTWTDKQISELPAWAESVKHVQSRKGYKLRAVPGVQ